MPLAHILMPQIARRAEEIAAATGHPSPTQAGYLQTIGAAPYKDPNVAPGVAPALPGVSLMPQPFRQGFYSSLTAPTPEMMPNAQASAMPPPDMSKPLIVPGKGKPMPMKMDLGAGAVGTDEAGRAVDKKGKKLGFLAAQSAPGRSLEMNRGDITPGFNPAARSAFGQQVLGPGFEKAMKQYGEEYNAYKENGYRWPKGFWEGWDPKEAKAARQTIENMVANQTDVGPNKKPVVY